MRTLPAQCFDFLYLFQKSRFNPRGIERPGLQDALPGWWPPGGRYTCTPQLGPNSVVFQGCPWVPSSGLGHGMKAHHYQTTDVSAGSSSRGRLGSPSALREEIRRSAPEPPEE